MRRIVVAGLRDIGAFSVENAVGACGVPDVATAIGWLELKYVADWPKGENTPVRIPCFTPDQKTWHLRWARAGGKSWVLLRVTNNWLLYPGPTAVTYLGRETKKGLLRYADKVWIGTPDWGDFIDFLRSPNAR